MRAFTNALCNVAHANAYRRIMLGVMLCANGVFLLLCIAAIAVAASNGAEAKVHTHDIGLSISARTGRLTLYCYDPGILGSESAIVRFSSAVLMAITVAAVALLVIVGGRICRCRSAGVLLRVLLLAAAFVAMTICAFSCGCCVVSPFASVVAEWWPAVDWGPIPVPGSTAPVGMLRGPDVFEARVPLAIVAAIAGLAGAGFITEALPWGGRVDALACAECGYNLTGNVSGRCSECGAPVPTRANEPSGPQSDIME